MVVGWRLWRSPDCLANHVVFKLNLRFFSPFSPLVIFCILKILYIVSNDSIAAWRYNLIARLTLPRANTLD